MVGVEYQLVHIQLPMLFVIRKVYRKSAAVIEFMASYYILDGTVFPSPTLGAIMQSRLAQCLYHVEKAVKIVTDDSVFHPSTGYAWKDTIKSTVDEDDNKSTTTATLTAAVDDSNVVELLLQDLMA